MTSPDDAPATFADLQIHPSVLQAVADVGYESPSAIQAATIPALMAGSDVVGLAQTGTGKTAAFAIPILSKIDTSSKATQALVLAPTRELALQVAEAFSRYGAHLPQINVLPIYGGSSYAVQLSGLKRGAQVVVGTPGRVIDHLERGTLDLSRIDYLVLDEADEMLTMGFAEDVERILSETPEYKQVALFSATMPPPIRKLTAKYLHDPTEVKVEAKTATAENISQRYIQVAGPRKMDALTRVLEVEPFEAMIVFVRTKQATEEVAERLRARGFSAAAINGDIPQSQRERTIAALKEGGYHPGIDVMVGGLNWSQEAVDRVLNHEMVVTYGGHFLLGAWAMVLLRDYQDGRDFAEEDVRLQIPMGAFDLPVARRFPEIGKADWRRVDFTRFSKSRNPAVTRYTFTPDAVLRQLGTTQ